MKQGQFSQEQIVAILQQHPWAGTRRGEQTIQAICREHTITETTFYRWRRIYGRMKISEAHRLKELEKENSRLKRLRVPFGCERDLEVDTLKEYLAKSKCASGETGAAGLPDRPRVLDASCLSALGVEPFDLPVPVTPRPQWRSTRAVVRL
jgi:putative transposase